MVLVIDDSSDIPIYQQLRNQIVMGISDGRLKPGEQLPTVRALAEEIGVNAMTVNKAYRLLKQEGTLSQSAEMVRGSAGNLAGTDSFQRRQRRHCGGSSRRRSWRG